MTRLWSLGAVASVLSALVCIAQSLAPDDGALDPAKVQNKTTWVRVVSLGRCENMTCVTFENVGSEPLFAIALTARKSGSETKSYGVDGGLALGARDTIQVATGASVGGSDAITILAAVALSGAWQGDAEEARHIFSYCAGRVVQDELASRILARAGGAPLSDALTDSISSDLNSLSEDTDTVVGQRGSADEDLHLAQLLTNGRQSFAFRSGLHDSKEAAARNFAVIRGAGAGAPDRAAEIIKRYYVVGASTLRSVVRGYREVQK